MSAPHVVVVGAGFAGLAAARALARAAVRVTVVDRHNYHTFQPLLYQVATAGLDPQDIGHSARGILVRRPGLAFRLGTVTRVDPGRRELCLADGDILSYDYLVLAAGAVTSTYGIPGVAEHAHPLKTLPDALRLRNHLLRRFEAAAVRPELVDDGALTVVVAGGGPTGVEMAGALVELFDLLLRRDFPRLRADRARVVLVELEDHLLSAFAPGLRDSCVATLRRRGVQVRLGRAIERVDVTSVRLDDGEVVAAHTLVWTAGVRASPLAEALGAPTGPGGRVVVGPDLQVPGVPGVFAAGDMAVPEAGVLPQLAPAAIQSGRHAARQIRRLLVGEPTRPFRYRDRGIMATVGRDAAVAQLPAGVRVDGRPAWWAWLLLHLVELVGFRNRVSVLVNWTWSYLTYDRAARLILDASEE
ncbi:MAG: NAD(P)/FAD-dependent oxidoreductase [Actinobacteria bacterium]|nr:NAD(P)/FAD-dependent oxidoreductase [Actinomycetota bacterium]